MNKIPIEIWFDICKYVSIYEISNLMCINTRISNIIKQNKWSFIDNIYNKISSTTIIPKTPETFNNFRFCIDWCNIILNNPNRRDIIPNEVIQWIEDRQDLEYICIYQDLSETTIRKCFNKINWRLLLHYQTLPVDLIEFITETYDLSNSDWNLIWLNPNINLEFLVKYIDHAQWHVISANKNLISFKLIEKYGNRLSLHELTKHGVNENIIKYYLPKMDIICWINVSQFTKLSMTFIKEHIDQLNLQFILNCQEIDESYLEDIIKNRLDDNNYTMCFQAISLNQKLSSDFIKKYKDDLYLKNLIRNKRISRKDLSVIF